jgi:hypothetical protein
MITVKTELYAKGDLTTKLQWGMKGANYVVTLDDKELASSLDYRFVWAEGDAMRQTLVRGGWVAA